MVNRSRNCLETLLGSLRKCIISTNSLIRFELSATMFSILNPRNPLVIEHVGLPVTTVYPLIMGSKGIKPVYTCLQHNSLHSRNMIAIAGHVTASRIRNCQLNTVSRALENYQMNTVHFLSSAWVCSRTYIGVTHYFFKLLYMLLSHMSYIMK